MLFWILELNLLGFRRINKKVVKNWNWFQGIFIVNLKFSFGFHANWVPTWSSFYGGCLLIENSLVCPFSGTRPHPSTKSLQNLMEKSKHAWNHSPNLKSLRKFPIDFKHFFPTNSIEPSKSNQNQNQQSESHSKQRKLPKKIAKIRKDNIGDLFPYKNYICTTTIDGPKIHFNDI